MGVIKRNALSKKYTTGSNSGGLASSVSPKRAISFNAPDQQYRSNSYVSTEPGIQSEIERRGPGNNVNLPQFSDSAETKRYQQQLRRTERNRPDDFHASELTNGYLKKLQNTEDQKPADFQSKYTQNISSLLNTIQNPQVFDLKSNDTYKQLYDNYKESYMAQGDKAMRDAQGAAAALTGGYGSTYSLAAGQQAYDGYMNRLNEQNMNIYQMALDDYWRNRNDNYNQLNAVNSQDGIDYGRYRDKVGDWKDDRNYYANQYQRNYSNDYGEYRDRVGDWQNDRAYYAGQAQNSHGNDFNMYQSGLDQYNAELNRKQAQEQFEAQQTLRRDENAQNQANWQAQWDYQLAQDALRAQQAAVGGGHSGRRNGGGMRPSGSKRNVKDALRAQQAAVGGGHSGRRNGGGTRPSGSKWNVKYDTDANRMKRMLKNNHLSQLDVARELAGLAEAGKYTDEQVDAIIDYVGIDWEGAQKADSVQNAYAASNPNLWKIPTATARNGISGHAALYDGKKNKRKK